MFIRINRTPNSPRKSVQIVHSKRDGQRVRQVIVKHLGVAADDKELEMLESLGKFLIAKMELGEQGSLFTPAQVQLQLQDALAASDARPRKPLPVDLTNFDHEQTAVRGIHQVYGRIYDDLGLSQLLPAKRYPASSRALREIVMARLAAPASKRESVRYLGWKMGHRLGLSQVYRMMDYIDESRVEELNRLAAERARELLPPQLDVYFFDCTTLYFESFVADELKAPGYSKDGKFKESQVLLALTVTEHGLPVQYRVLPGQTFEGSSLRLAVEDLRRHTPVRRAVVVADRGMLSKDNLGALREAGIDYIVGARLRSLPKSLRQLALKSEDYVEVEGETGGRVVSFACEDDRIVVHWSAKRARKDARDRAKQVEKLRRKWARHKSPKEFMSNRGYARFLDVKGGKIALDEEKIEAEARWDGLHGVRTSLADASAETLLNAYRGLWQVEQTFRVTKHDLQVRPIFHWTERRIRAHIAINFMALLCVRHLEYRCALQYKRLSPEVIRDSLVNMECWVAKDKTDGRRYSLPCKPTAHAPALYKLAGVTLSSVAFEIVD